MNTRLWGDRIPDSSCFAISRSASPSRSICAPFKCSILSLSPLSVLLVFAPESSQILGAERIIASGVDRRRFALRSRENVLFYSSASVRGELVRRIRERISLQPFREHLFQGSYLQRLSFAEPFGSKGIHGMFIRSNCDFLKTFEIVTAFLRDIELFKFMIDGDERERLSSCCKHLFS